jgi:hypothetical protein
MGVYLVLWREVTVRLHRWLLPHDEWGDIRRVLLWWLGFLSIPLATLALVVIAILLGAMAWA